MTAASIRERLGRFPLSILQLGMRVGVGMVFFKAGLLKYESFQFAVKLFEDEYKLPFVPPAIGARMATINELTTSTLLFLGLGTRLATLPLFGMISVIQIFVYPTAWPDHVLWGSILLFLLTRGPGSLSVDYLIERSFPGFRARFTALIEWLRCFPLSIIQLVCASAWDWHFSLPASKSTDRSITPNSSSPKPTRFRSSIRLLPLVPQ